MLQAYWVIRNSKTKVAPSIRSLPKSQSGAFCAEERHAGGLRLKVGKDDLKARPDVSELETLGGLLEALLLVASCDHVYLSISLSCVYVCTYIHIYIYTYIPIYLYTYIPIYLYTYITIYLYLYTYIPIYIIPIYHIYIYTYIHIYNISFIVYMHA